MTAPNPLATPFTLGTHTLNHRIVLAPMTRMRASQDGIINASAAQYYSQRATKGGLLIPEGVNVHPRGKGYPNTPGIWSEEQVEVWRVVTDAVREKGGVVFAQLWHVGRVSVPSMTGGLPPLSPTKILPSGPHQLLGEGGREEEYVESQVMTSEDIESVTEQFANAARNAIRAGFDGVEIHGANGYLLDTFILDKINDRTDEDSDRISHFTEYSRQLDKLGLAYVHMVEARHEHLIVDSPYSEVLAKKLVRNVHTNLSESAASVESDLPSLPEVPSLWNFRTVLKNTPFIVAGYEKDAARKAVEEGRVDLVAFGRHFTSNPDLVLRIIEDLPLTKYDRKTFYTLGLEGYVDWKTAEELGLQKENA